MQELPVARSDDYTPTQIGHPCAIRIIVGHREECDSTYIDTRHDLNDNFALGTRIGDAATKLLASQACIDSAGIALSNSGD